MASASRLAKVLGRLPLACPPGELLLLLEKAAPAAAQALLHDGSHGAARLRLQASGKRLAITEPCPASSPAVQQHSFASSALAAADQPEQQQQAQDPQQVQQSTSSYGEHVGHKAAQQQVPAAAECAAAEWIQQEYQQQQQQPDGTTDTLGNPAATSSSSSSSSSSSYSSSEEVLSRISGNQAALAALYDNNNSSSESQSTQSAAPERLDSSSSSSNEVDISSRSSSNEVYTSSNSKVNSSSDKVLIIISSSSSSGSSSDSVVDPAQGFLTAQGKQRIKVQLDKSINMCPTVKALAAVIETSALVPTHSAALALQRLRRLHIDQMTRHRRQLNNLQQQLQSREPDLGLIRQQQQRLEQQQQQHEADVEQLTQKLCDQLTKGSRHLTSEQIVQVMSALGTLCSPLPSKFYPLLGQLLDQLKGCIPTLRTNYLPLLATALASLKASNLDSQHSVTPTDHKLDNSSNSERSAAAAAAAAAIDASDLADLNHGDSSSSSSTTTTTVTECPVAAASSLAAAAAATVDASDLAEHPQPPASTAPAAAAEPASEPAAAAAPAAGVEASDSAVVPAGDQAVLPSNDAAAAAEAARQLLVELCEFIQRSPSVASLDAGGVARLISAFGRLGHYDWQAMRRLSLISIALAQSMTASNITSILMGCAKLRHYDQELCAVLAESAESRMSTATGPQVSQIAWALAHMKHDIPGVFAAAAQQATQQAHELEPRHLSNISWAFAVRKAYSPTLCNTTAARVQQLLQLSDQSKAVGLDLGVQTLEPHHLSLIAWSFAKQGHKLQGFMQDLGEASAAVVDQMLPQNVSNLAWAFGRLSVAYPKLFDALTAAAKGSKLEGFGNQNMTDLAWGCAATKYQDDELFDLLSRSTVNIMHELSPHSLSDLIWAFAVNKAPSATAVLAAAAPAAAACLERFSAGMLADLMYSYAYTKVYDEKLLQACAQVLPLRTISLEQDTEAQAKVLWCLKTFNFRDSKLEGTLEEIIPSIKQLLVS